jgi:hypothetical protein
MNQPKFSTELEVTQALAKREIDGVEALEYYRQARAYQAYLKTLLPKFYRRPSGRKVVWLNNRPGYSTKED